MLAALWNVPKAEDTDSLNFFSYHNQSEHLNIVNAIRQQKTVDLYVSILDPIAPEDFQNWLYRHQIVHNQMNQALGISGNDLTEVDLKDNEALEDWIELHFSEHQQANLLLGI